MNPPSIAAIGATEGGCMAYGDREERRATDLKGFGVLQDGKTFDLTVVDLSYNGCKVRTTLAMLPGLKLTLSILGLKGRLNAVVRWCRDNEAGLQFNPEEQLERTAVPRKDERIALDAQLSLRRSGRKAYHGRALDLTPAGCRVEFVERPGAGELMWVKFDGLEAAEATVRWVDGYIGGLEFTKRIYSAVFEMLLARIVR